jgi:RNA polymerase sigma-70 factor (ECF subfamily)
MDDEGGEAKIPAFTEIIDRHHRRLINTARKIVNQDVDAEEVVQETLAEVWKHADEIPAEKIERYLFRAVKLNSLKWRARRRKGCSLEEISEPAAMKGEDGLWNEIDPLTLEKALDGLPETQQAVIRMKYYTELTFREIGRTLSISANTAASRCRYALENLRKNLTQNRGEKS